jgi:hypothetical protein
MSSPVWFIIVDSNGVPYKKTTADKVSVPSCADVADFRDAVKVKHSNKLSSVDAADLHVYKNKPAFVEGMEERLEEDSVIDGLGKSKKDALIVVVPDDILEAPKSLLVGEEIIAQTRRMQRFEISDLTTQLQSFANAQLVDECLQSPDDALLPYPQTKIKKIYIRKCYEDVFELFLKNIELESFAISGTPGIGKSLFFVYILHRLMKDFKRKTLPLKPNRIVYHIQNTYKCFDLEQQTVSIITKLEAEVLVRETDSLYIVDGRTISVQPACISLYIASPRSDFYKDFVKQKTATEWYFPVWTREELQSCHCKCYSDLPIETLKERYLVYGGVARLVFYKDYSKNRPKTMEVALADVDAVKGVRNIGDLTNIFSVTHTLLHIIVSNDGLYQFTHVDIASKYVGEQLWIRHSAEMLTNLQEMFGGSPNEISKHLFEIYGHLVFSVGQMQMPGRCYSYRNYVGCSQ